MKVLGVQQLMSKKGLEFGLKQYQQIDKYCKKKYLLVCLCMGFRESKFLNKFNLKYTKIASAMIVDKKFLNYVASQKNYIYFNRHEYNKKYF